MSSEESDAGTPEESMIGFLQQQVMRLEAELSAVKTILTGNHSILSTFHNRITQCEVMAGIDSTQFDYVSDFRPDEDGPAKRQRSSSDDTRDTDNFMSSPNLPSHQGGLTIEQMSSVVAKSLMLLQQNQNQVRSMSMVQVKSPNSPGGSKRKLESKACTYPDCIKMAHGPSYQFCLRHGGGYRCQQDGCTRSAYSTKYCSKHGGGPRCQWQSCVKGAISNSTFCRRHGGGNRCQHPNCPEGARQGFNYCLNHGGYNPCAFPGCPCVSLLTSGFCRQHNAAHKKMSNPQISWNGPNPLMLMDGSQPTSV